jgi:hypothetical protein
MRRFIEGLAALFAPRSSSPCSIPSTSPSIRFPELAAPLIHRRREEGAEASRQAPPSRPSRWPSLGGNLRLAHLRDIIGRPR